MAAIVLYMSMSLDGFVTGPNARPDNALGDGGEVLHHWIFPDGNYDGGHVGAGQRLRGVNRQVFDELMDTGAVIAGRGTFEAAGGWGGDHHDGVPIFILSRHPKPDWAAAWPNVRYLPDLGEAVHAAKQAAEQKNVMVHGVRLVPQALAEGLLDEIAIHLIPVLLGGGQLLFDHLDSAQVSLERISERAGEHGVTHLRFRVNR